MSGSTVTSNALQFTNDNKNAYAYSGIIGVTNAEKTLLLMQTNSEYLMAKLQILNGTTSNEDFTYKVFFNDVIVAQWHFVYASTIHQLIEYPYLFTIPPFTTVKVTALNVSSGVSRDHTATVTASVGMPQRVGNLND